MVVGGSGDMPCKLYGGGGGGGGGVAVHNSSV